MGFPGAALSGYWFPGGCTLGHCCMETVTPGHRVCICWSSSRQLPGDASAAAGGEVSVAAMASLGRCWPAGHPERLIVGVFELISTPNLVV